MATDYIQRFTILGQKIEAAEARAEAAEAENKKVSEPGTSLTSGTIADSSLPFPFVSLPFHSAYSSTKRS